jgi:hypothetical protein
MATPHSDGPSLLPFPSHLTIYKHSDFVFDATWHLHMAWCREKTGTHSLPHNHK